MTQPTHDIPWWRNDPWQGRHLFRENRAKFPAAELRKYNNMHVAWYPDGSGIRDADEDGEVLVARLQASGDDLSWYNFEFVSDEPLF